MNMNHDWDASMVTNSTEIFTDGIDYQSGTNVDDYGFDVKQRIAISVIYCLISVTGITGNTCVILAVLLSKKLHTLTNILVVNLSVTDFLTCCSILVQVVVLLTSDQILQVVPKQLCVLASAVNFIGVSNSLMTLTLVAFMRWYVITRSIRGRRGLHTPGKIAVLLVIAWTISLVSMLLPPGLGIGTLGYSAAYKQCLTIDENHMVVYYSMLQSGGCFAFVAMAVSFYAAIFLFVRKNSRTFSNSFNSKDNTKKTNLKLENMNDSSVKNVSYLVETGHRESEEHRQLAALFRKRELSITKNLLVVFCIFLVCFIPFAVTLAIPGGSLSNIYTTALLYSNACINPVVYCLKHDQFRDVLRPLMLCKWSRIPKPTTILRRCLSRSKRDSRLTSITSTSTLTTKL